MIIKHAALVLVVILAGCYESKIPITNDLGARIDPQLVGSWKSVKTKTNVSEYLLVIYKLNEREHLMSWRDSDDNETVITRGFISRFNTVSILNLQNVKSMDDDRRKYMFFKYKIDNETLVVAMLSEDYGDLRGREFTSETEFQAYIQKHLAQKDLFEDVVEFKRDEGARLEISTVHASN